MKGSKIKLHCVNLLKTKIWVCLDIIFGKHESKDGGHD